MTQDEFQALLLQELSSIKTDISSIKDDINILKSDVSALKSDVSILKSDVSTLKSEVSTLKSDVFALKSDVSTLKIKVDSLDVRLERVENKQIEQGDILTALLHNQEVANAKLEALEATTATNTSIQRLDAKFSILNDRLFEQEVEIQVLKIAK